MTHREYSVYDAESLSELVESGEITSEEEAFMQGYDQEMEFDDQEEDE